MYESHLYAKWFGFTLQLQMGCLKNDKMKLYGYSSNELCTIAVLFCYETQHLAHVCRQHSVYHTMRQGARSGPWVNVTQTVSTGSSMSELRLRGEQRAEEALKAWYGGADYSQKHWRTPVCRWYQSNCALPVVLPVLWNFYSLSWFFFLKYLKWREMLSEVTWKSES